MPSKSFVFLTLFSLFFTGCAHQSFAPDAQSNVLTGKRILGHEVQQEELPEHSILAVTPEMREFVLKHVDLRKSDRVRSRALIDALLDQLNFGVNYDSLLTQTAAETFSSQEGNCLSFTTLFVALAREAGLKTSFNEVDIPPSWGRLEQNKYIAYRHINAIVELRQGLRIIDLDSTFFEQNFDYHQVSDDVAKAQYYNNIAVGEWKQNNQKQAFLHLRKAIDLSPDLSYLWSNLGVVYRRSELYEEAEEAFVTALELEPGQKVAASNLEQLYEGSLVNTNNQTDAASMKKVQAYRNRNPYFRYDQAELALENNDTSLALEHIQTAIKYHPNDHRFYHLAARVYARMGDLKQVQEYLKTAEEMSENEDDQLRYRGKLNYLAIN